jgi:hypothetical protein
VLSEKPTPWIEVLLSSSLHKYLNIRELGLGCQLTEEKALRTEF